MNKETLDLLQQLAAKLGATAEHLWAALIRQAFISGCVDLVLYAFTGCLIWFTFKTIPKLAKALDDDDRTEAEAVGAIAAIGALLVAVVVFGIGSAVSVSGTITAFSNPEYWALQQILSAIGK